MSVRLVTVFAPAIVAAIMIASNTNAQDKADKFYPAQTDPFMGDWKSLGDGDLENREPMVDEDGVPWTPERLRERNRGAYALARRRRNGRGETPPG